jgi:alcohol dehydrogenase class IV
MNSNYCMPTRIVMGDDCLSGNRGLLQELGKKALIVTGRHSAKQNGALGDLVKTLEANGQSYGLFDKVMSNPTVDCAFEAAGLCGQEGCDFLVAIGGGSPMDVAKVAAALALNPMAKPAIFSTTFTSALPIVAIPTTAGTGSEVTPNAILTNDAAQTKTSVASPALFPRFAFLDAKYMSSLPRVVTINTAIDALSHSVEGMLTVRSSVISDPLAKASIRAIAECFGPLEGNNPGKEVRQKLLWASTLGGMVIANTGTTAVHAMGYQLTYHKHIDHGRANGLLLGAYLRFVAEKEKAQATNRIGEILAALDLGSLEDFSARLDMLLGPREKVDAAALEGYAEKAFQAKNIANATIKPEKADLLAVLQQSIGEN